MSLSWEPITTAPAHIRSLDNIVERNRGGATVYGPLWVWSEEDGLVKAEYVDWGEGHTHTHWRKFDTDYEGDRPGLQPTHWTVINFPHVDAAETPRPKS